MEDKFLLTDEECKEHHVAFMELHMLGLIEFKDDERFEITDKGLKEVMRIVKRLPIKECILLMSGIPEIVDDFYDREKETE